MVKLTDLKKVGSRLRVKSRSDSVRLTVCLRQAYCQLVLFHVCLCIVPQFHCGSICEHRVHVMVLEESSGE